MANIVRHLVSKKKRRFEWGEFDLDLTYITDRIVAMGFPSEHIEGLYRNKMRDVQKFFESLHAGHYRIYNLCSERKYDFAKFAGEVAEFPFDDHGPPPLAMIKAFCLDVEQWLDADPFNVIGVHCKAGKGRTGTMISCWLMYSGYCKTSNEACRLFANKRTMNGKGITIPSQFRYVKYWEHILNNAPPSHPRSLIMPDTSTVVLTNIVMHGVPNFNIGGGCEPFIGICQRNKHVYYSRPLKIKKGTEIVEFECGDIILSRDVKIQFFNKSSKGQMFTLSFHTAYVAANYIKFRRQELDRVNKDSAYKHFGPGFQVELYFNKLQQPPTLINRAEQTASSYISSISQANTIFTCGFCSQPINPDQISVNNGTKNYHWNCLACSVCKKPLGDDVVFRGDGDSTCASCESKNKKAGGSKEPSFFEFCQSCGEVIVDHQSESVGELSWHRECFECNRCKKHLANAKLTIDNSGKPVCEPSCPSFLHDKDTESTVDEPAPTTPPPSAPSDDINNNHNKEADDEIVTEKLDTPNHHLTIEAHKNDDEWKVKSTHSTSCPGCSLPVSTELVDRIIAMGTIWHKKCFVCSQCKNPFPDNRYYIRNDQGYCESCDCAVRLSLLPSCVGCMLPIEDTEMTEALGGMWHLQCFACAHCATPINGSFASKHGKVYCKEHYEEFFCSRCDGCNKVLKGSFYRALNRAYHMECFKCTRCSTNLASGQYFELSGRPVCFNCKEGTNFTTVASKTAASVDKKVRNTKFLCEHRDEKSWRVSKRLSIRQKSDSEPPAPISLVSDSPSSPSSTTNNNQPSSISPAQSAAISSSSSPKPTRSPRASMMISNTNRLSLQDKDRADFDRITYKAGFQTAKPSTTARTTTTFKAGSPPKSDDISTSSSSNGKKKGKKNYGGGQVYEDGTADPPAWKADDAHENCERCDKQFTFLFRKHHCRACGDVVCGDCSTHKVSLPQFRLQKPKRVCDNCYGELANSSQ
eukprot:TRINITY_DN2268_c0_g1_i2.p1 TRINITY_DN2268_c0_g1~~TRINITY_DN2268_c0_g1_i2.p1  ORF type:complete len:979 (-),score=246.51 TRINITY_DN2268_c0_g1_i2:41-2977(-)